MFSGCSSLELAPELPATKLAQYCYSNMFSGCSSLVMAPVLPATDLTGCNNCYEYLFDSCTNLEIPSGLPATKLADYCYQYMFKDCKKMETPPGLDASTLANYCYKNMFEGCTGITTSPVLAATSLKTGCYEEMFKGCSSLRYIICQACPGEAVGTDSTYNWVVGVADSGVFSKAPRADWTTGNNGIPENWKVIDGSEPLSLEFFDSAGQVKITKGDDQGYFYYYAINYGAKQPVPSNGIIQAQKGDIVSLYGEKRGNDQLIIDCTADCYIYGNIMSLLSAGSYKDLKKLYGTRVFYRLFYKNSHIKNHPILELILPATSLTTECYYYMFQYCTGLTRAFNLPARDLTNHCYYGMFEYCTGLKEAAELPALNLTDGCYCAMFWGCTSLEKAPILFATTLYKYCYTGMFQDCTSLVTGPVLIAKTLAPRCYDRLFRGCLNLKNVTCLATDLSAANATDGWFQDVPAGGTFTKAAGVEWPVDPEGDQYIPAGWTVVEQ
jgi:hypothetical protein